MMRYLSVGTVVSSLSPCLPYSLTFLSGKMTHSPGCVCECVCVCVWQFVYLFELKCMLTLSGNKKGKGQKP